MNDELLSLKGSELSFITPQTSPSPDMLIGTVSDSDRIPFYANTESTYITKSDAKVGFYFKIFWDSENKRNIFVMFDTDL